MNSKKITKISIIAISTLLFVVLGLAMIFTPNFNKGKDIDFTGTKSYKDAIIESNDGVVESLEESQAKEKAYAEFGGDSELSQEEWSKAHFSWIVDKNTFDNFIANADKKVGYLGKDFDLKIVDTSNKLFEKGRVLEGNGKKINITLENIGNTNFSNTTYDPKEVFYKDYTPASGQEAVESNLPKIQATGFLMAINKGLVRNVNVKFTGNASRTIQCKGEYLTDAVGIFAGINDGEITNCSLDYTNFDYINAATNDTTKFNNQSSYVGGMVGIAVDASIISRVTVLNNGISGEIAGRPQKSLNAVGGVVGGLFRGTAKVEFVTLKGTGSVSAKSLAANEIVNYSGGILGTTNAPNGAKIISMPLNSDADRGNQINGIISSFSGLASYYTLDGNKGVSGALFGGVTSDNGIGFMLFTFKYSDIHANNYVDNAAQGRNGQIKNWSWASAQGEGNNLKGEVVGVFNYENPFAPVKVMAIGKYDMVNDTDTAKQIAQIKATSLVGSRKFYEIQKSYAGGIIWEFRNSIDPNVPAIGEAKKELANIAEYNVVGNATEALVCEFGEAYKMVFSEENKFKKYDGISIKNEVSTPKLVSVIGSVVPTVVDGTGYKYSIKGVFEDVAKELNISRTDASGNYDDGFNYTTVPGTYKIKPIFDLGEVLGSSNQIISYYNPNSMALVAYEQGSTYEVTIGKGIIQYFNGIEPSKEWQKKVDISVGLSGVRWSANLYDYLRINSGGSLDWQSAKEEKVTYTDTTNTGSNGRNISLSFYKDLTYYEDNNPQPITVKIPVSNAITSFVKIDNVSPVIEDLEYYDYSNDTKGARLNEEDLKKWRTSKVLVEYTVSDSYSGLTKLTADPKFQLEQTELETEGDDANKVITKIKGRFVLSDVSTFKLNYLDKAGNSDNSKEVKSNIDITKPEFTKDIKIYNSNAGSTGDFYYSSVNVEIVAKVGDSGGKLMYSYKEGENSWGNWIDWANWNNANSDTLSLYINWSMKKATLRIKFVSELYGEVLYQHRDETAGPQEAGVLPSGLRRGSWLWTVYPQIAEIDFTKSHIKIVKDANDGTGILGDYTDNELLMKTFSKDYDGNNETFDLAKGNNFQLVVTSKNSKSLKRNINGEIVELTREELANIVVNVKTSYRQSNAGDTYLVLSMQLEEEDKYKYIVGFNNGDTTFEIKVKIYPVKKVVDLEQLARDKEIRLEYFYGYDIDKTFDLATGVNNEFVTFEFITDANKDSQVTGTPIPVDAKLTKPNNNYLFEIKGSGILIKPRPVDLKLFIAIDREDEKAVEWEEGNINYDGLARRITGNYKNIAGKEINAIISAKLEGIPCDGPVIKEIGQYLFSVDLGDKNYTLGDGFKTFKIEVIKVELPISVEDKIVEYNSASIGYDIKVKGEGLNVDRNYSNSEFTVSYYKYHSLTITIDEKGNKVYTTEATTDENPTPAEKVIERGAYKVVIEFMGNDNYLPTTVFARLIIIQAKTEIVSNNLQVVYTGETFTYDMDKAESKIVGMVARNVVKEDLQLFVWSDEDGDYVLATDENKWFSEVVANRLDIEQPYKFKLVYVGYKENEGNYYACEKEVTLTILYKQFEGLTFDGRTEVYSGNEYSIGLIGNPGSGSTVEYTYSGKTQKEKFVFKDAGRYSVKITVKRANYKTWVVTKVMEITKATLGDDVIVKNAINKTYDGKEHYASLIGLDKDSSGNYSYKGLSAKVISTTVSGVNVGEYVGSFTVAVTNYELKKIDTLVTIIPKVIDVKFNLDGVDSKTNMWKEFAEYVDLDGNKVACQIYIFDINTGEPVTANEDGTLPPGKYKATVSFKDVNYSSEQYVEFTIEKAAPNLGLVIGLAVGGVVILAGVAVMIIIIIKKKRA